MFHRNRPSHPADQHAQAQARRGFFHRNRAPQHVEPQFYGNVNHPQGYYRDPYYEGSTRSDWDHYAVRHEEALIGDPLPIMDSGLNLAAQPYNNGARGPYGSGPLANGPLNRGYDDRHYDKRHPVPDNFDRFGNPLIGPVTANGPLAGNLSSGTVVERNLLQGPGKGRTRTGWVDDNTGGRQWGSTAWGSEPLYGSGYGGYGSQPLYGYRDGRDVATPLLPDNPWTHNELGRDYSDAYKRGTMAYSSVNNAFVAPPVTESFTNYGPNGELIQGSRTRVIREEIVPATGALGQSTTVTDHKVIKDEIIPIQSTHQHEVIDVKRGVVVTETKTPVTIVEKRTV